MSHALGSEKCGLTQTPHVDQSRPDALADPVRPIGLFAAAMSSFDSEGSRDNNIVLEHFWEGAPFLDPNAASPAEKYVYLGHGGEKGFYRFTSPDDLKWKQDDYPKNVLRPG